MIKTVNLRDILISKSLENTSETLQVLVLGPSVKTKVKYVNRESAGHISLDELLILKVLAKYYLGNK